MKKITLLMSLFLGLMINLIIAQDVSTAVPLTIPGFYIGNESTSTKDLVFNNDGTKLFLVNDLDNAIIEYNLSIPFDLYSAVYSGENEEFYVGDQETSVTDLKFNTDGTKLFITGFGDKIIEYNLTMPFDVSTAVYAGDNGLNFTFTAPFTEGFSFNNDGTKLFIIDRSSRDRITAYNLNIPFDISSYVYVGEIFNLGTEEDNPKDITFNNDGTKMFVVGSRFNRMGEYNLATAFDVSTAVYSGTNLRAGLQPEGVVFNTDGTRMFIVDNDRDEIIQYVLSIPYDISTAQILFLNLEEAFSVRNETIQPFSLNFNNDGTKMYIVDYENRSTILEYLLNVPYDVSTAVYAGVDENFTGTEARFVTTLVFNDNGNKMYVTGSLSDDIFEYDLGTAFDISTATFTGNEISIGAQESFPTGLALNTDGTKMFVVGLRNDSVVEYDLSIPYNISTAVYGGLDEEFYLGNESSEPRDIVFNEQGSKMFILDERSSNVYEYNLAIAFDVSTAVYLENEELFIGRLEADANGLAFNNDGTKMFIVGESNDTIYEFSLVIPSTFSLTTSATNGTIITNIPPANGVYNDGTTVKLTATEDNGFVFIGWSGDATGTDNPLSITMNTDKNITALFSNTLSINDNQLSKDIITLHPNPASELIYLKLDGYQKAEITIYALDGKLIKQSNWTANTAINISELHSGMYFINIATNDGSATTPFIKK